MLPLERALDDSDRRHASALLSAREAAPAARFLRDRVFIDEAAAEALRALARDERERLISELVWRITCHLDGSVTAVVSPGRYELGAGFAAACVEEGGREAFRLTRA